MKRGAILVNISRGQKQSQSDCNDSRHRLSNRVRLHVMIYPSESVSRSGRYANAASSHLNATCKTGVALARVNGHDSFAEQCLAAVSRSDTSETTRLAS